ncbi:hypothetical protein RD792_002987 [Penstemon davidsonii]|uniref:J domain-containing protein n=1 Tax=Penstemon davidsonii TaxID=160366 RepID=A0ABR0DSI6_9LAMI|nr:hypothetical protein RD792_002987 [Penstemon davidsonii]
MSTLSFSSNLTRSRISIGNPSGPKRTRPAARIQAFYSPTETTETLYEVLGITDIAGTFSDIKKAYKQMARKYHPDVSPPDRVDEYTRRFIIVHEAYETLSNPKTRALYDEDLAGGFRYAFSDKRSNHYDQRMKETEEWKMKWESQLNELNQRENANKDYSRQKMSWGARMRKQRL